MKNKKQMTFIIVIAAIVVLGAVGTIGAYLTADESLYNEFEVGNVKIDLSEPLYSELSEDERNILPSDDIVKDPIISNTGENEAYVFMRVDIPCRDVVTADESTGERQPHAIQPLVTFNINSDWTLVESDVPTEEEGYATYVYAYTKGTGSLVALASPIGVDTGDGTTYTYYETSPLFANRASLGGKPGIHLINILEDVIEPKDALRIPITAYGIQTDNIKQENSIDPQTVWEIVSNHVSSQR